MKRLYLLIILFGLLTVTNAQTLWTWGANFNGELGVGALQKKITPQKVLPITYCSKIFGGQILTIVLKDDGTLWACGINTLGQFGNGTTSLNQTTLIQISPLNDWVDVSCGETHVLALKNDGTLWAWGYNFQGTLGDGTTINRISPVQVGMDNDWAQFDAGTSYSIAIKKNGTLWAWGFDSYGYSASDFKPYQIGTDSDWRKVSLNGGNSLAIKKDGTIWAWGFNFYGELGNGTNSPSRYPIQIGNSKDWVDISTGIWHSIALKNDGSLWTWGYNYYGQLGDGTNTNKNSPKQIGTDTNWKQISAGKWYSSALKSDGSLWMWGYNVEGELGDGTTINKKIPTRLGNENNWLNISAGDWHMVALRAIASSTTNANICDGASYTFNGITYNTSGTYKANLITATGEDSTAILVLKVNTRSSSLTKVSICQGESYTFNGGTYASGGTYNTQLTNAAGCDSTVTLILNVAQPTTSNTNAKICQGENYSFNGNTYSATGNYIAHLTNAAGCDSTASLMLKVEQASTSITNATICQGETYSFNSNTYTTAGTYSSKLINSVGCDSIANLFLNVNLTTSSTTKVNICQGDTFTFNGTNYFTSGTYIVHFINSVGCDSTAVLLLNVNQPTSSITQASICQGESYSFNGTNYSTAGTFLSHFTNAAGCDSIATLILKINQPTSTVLNVEMCEGETYSLGGSSYTSAGTYTAHFTNATGCDSTVTLYLSVLPNIKSTLVEEICSNEFYHFGNNTLSQTGVYTQHFSSASGCDSTVTLTLMVKPTYMINRSLNIIYGETDTIDNQIYDKPGTFTQTYTATNGCDSTIITTVSYLKSLCPKIFAPSYFTPNGDGMNDYLEIENLNCYQKTQVEIFDRYGKQLFSSKTSVLSWDGNYLGLPMPSTDYWYIIILHDTAERITGHFLLKR